jgi:transposase
MDSARAKGKLAKTDTIYARILAGFGKEIQLQVRPLSDKQTEEIKALLVRWLSDS